MPKKMRFLIGVVIGLAAATAFPQAALAYTYQTYSHHSSNSGWVFIPILLFVLALGGTIIYQRSKSAKPNVAGPIKISSIVQQKLEAGENPLRLINNGKADFVATDKRVLRFSRDGFEQLKYSEIASVEYKSSAGKKTVTRVLMVFCAIVAVGIAIGIWSAAFDSSVRNVSKLDAVIVSVVVIGLLLMCFMAFSRDFGFYQVELKQGVAADAKSWRIIRPPAYMGNANVIDFIQVIKQHLVL
jgi:hypothetical protein